jgi:hypothetical protein
MHSRCGVFLRMKTSIFIFGLIISSLLTFGQSGQLTDEQISKSGAIQLVFAESLEQATKLANQDIDNGTPFLLLQSGIVPVVYTTDNKFEDKYKVYYYESGCSGSKEKFAIEYNRTIFKHLTDKYGKKWKKEIRKDVIGFRN